MAPFFLHRFWFLLALFALTGQLLMGMQARSAHLQAGAGTFLCSLETPGTGSTVGQALADFLEDQDTPSGPDAGHCEACPAAFAAGLPGPAFVLAERVAPAGEPGVRRARPDNLRRIRGPPVGATGPPA